MITMKILITLLAIALVAQGIAIIILFNTLNVFRENILKIYDHLIDISRVIDKVIVLNGKEKMQ